MEAARAERLVSMVDNGRQVITLDPTVAAPAGTISLEGAKGCARVVRSSCVYPGSILHAAAQVRGRGSASACNRAPACGTEAESIRIAAEAALPRPKRHGHSGGRQIDRIDQPPLVLCLLLSRRVPLTYF